MKPNRPIVIDATGGRGMAVAIAVWKLLGRIREVPIIIINTALDLFDVTVPSGVASADHLRPLLIVPPQAAKLVSRNGVPKPRGLEDVAAGVGAGAVAARAYWGAVARIRTISRHFDDRRRYVLARGATFASATPASISISAFGGATGPGATMAISSHLDSGATTKIRFSIVHVGYPYPDAMLADAVALLQMKEFELATMDGFDVFGPRPVRRADLEILHAIDSALDGEQGAAASTADSLGKLADLIARMTTTGIIDNLRQAANVGRGAGLEWDALGHHGLRGDTAKATTLVRAMVAAKVERLLVQPPPVADVELPEALRALTVDRLLDRIALDDGAIGDAAVENLVRRFPRLPMYSHARNEVASFEANSLATLRDTYAVRADAVRNATTVALREAIAQRLDQFRCLAPVGAMLQACADGLRAVRTELDDRITNIENELAQREQMIDGHPKPWFWGWWRAYRHYTALLREKAHARVDAEVLRQGIRVSEELLQDCQHALDAVRQAEGVYGASADARELQLQQMTPDFPLTRLELEILSRDALEPRADEIVGAVVGRFVAECRDRLIDAVLAELDRLVGDETERALRASPADLSSMWTALSDDGRRQHAQSLWRMARPCVPIKDDVQDLPHVAFLVTPSARKSVAEDIQHVLEGTNQPDLNITIVEEPTLNDEIILIRMIRGIRTKDLRGFEDWQEAVTQMLDKVAAQRLAIHPLAYLVPFPHSLEDRHVSWLQDAWKQVDATVDVSAENFFGRVSDLWKRMPRAIVDRADQLIPGSTQRIVNGWEV
ncbi:MAG: hypothetical protein LAO77_19710 [Acidobacteriia bacterium]|nr:hypothetical protein [Terriglobia bacterium]